jgi:hypothetical protein
MRGAILVAEQGSGSGSFPTPTYDDGDGGGPGPGPGGGGGIPGSGGEAPATTIEYSGDGSGLNAALNDAGDTDVVGLEVDGLYNLGADGEVHLEGRVGPKIVARGAVIYRPNRGNTAIFRVDGGGSSFAMYDGIVRGSKPSDGKFSHTYEDERGIALGGIVGAEFARCFVQNVGGDGLYITGGNDQWSDGVRFHHGGFSEIGRMAVALTDGARFIVVDFNTLTRIAYIDFDIEPNGATVGGETAGAEDVRFSDNVIGTGPYGTYPADLTQAFGYLLAVTDASAHGVTCPAKRIELSRNVLSTGVMRVLVTSGMDAEDIVVNANRGATTFSPTGDISHVVQFNDVAGGAITDNVQACVNSGVFATEPGSSGITVSGNVTA